jgi:hypothetical protein
VPTRKLRPRSSRALVALVCVSLLATDCGGSRSSQRLFEFVPASSVFAASVNWHTVSSDDALKRIVNGGSVERLFGEFGVDGADVDEFVIFSDGGDARAGSTGVVLRGGYEADSVIKQLVARGWREQTQGDATIYASPNGNDYLAVPDDHLLVAGTRAGVVNVLKSGDGENLAAHPSYEKLAAHLDAGNPPLFVVVAAPQRVQDMTDAGLAISSVALGFTGLGAIGGIVKQLGAVRGIGCAIEHEGDAFPVEFIAVMRDEDAASLVSGTLNLAQSFASALPPDGAAPADRAAFENFQKMSITRDVEVLSIRVVMTEAQLQMR